MLKIKHPYNKESPSLKQTVRDGNRDRLSKEKEGLSQHKLLSLKKYVLFIQV